MLVRVLQGTETEVHTVRGLQKVHGHAYYEKIAHDFQVFCTKINLHFYSIFLQTYI